MELRQYINVNRCKTNLQAYTASNITIGYLQPDRVEYFYPRSGQFNAKSQR